MSVDDAEVGLTERGRRALRAPDGLRADHLLFLEILARIGGCAGGKNVEDMTDELIAHFGSAETALTAVTARRADREKLIAKYSNGRSFVLKFRLKVALIRWGLHK